MGEDFINNDEYRVESTCSFSGHRPGSLPWGEDECDTRCVALKARILSAARNAICDGYRHFIFGAARGCDMYFFDALMLCKNEGITIEAAVPFAGQCERWPRADQNRYYSALEKCDKLTLLQRDYSPHCMARRNRYMTDNSQRLIAVYSGGRGGTAQTIRYAKEMGRQTVLISPYGLCTAD